MSWIGKGLVALGVLLIVGVGWVLGGLLCDKEDKEQDSYLEDEHDCRG
jgi:hypothetical protein